MMITAKYNGRCSCGARFNAGARVRWARGAGVTCCPSCKLTVLDRREITVRGVSLHLVVKGRGTVPTVVSVGVNSAELSGCGAIHVHRDGTANVGAASPMVRADMCDYLPHAREAALEVFAA